MVKGQSVESLIILGLLFSIVVDVLLSATVFLHDYRTRASQYFSVFTLFVPVWAIGVLLLVYGGSHELAEFGLLLFGVGPMVVSLFMLGFSEIWPRRLPAGKHLHFMYLVPVALLGLIFIFTPEFFLDGIVLSETGKNHIEFNRFGYVFYTAFFIFYFSLTYLRLYQQLKIASGAQRIQVGYTLVGIAIGSGLAVVSNLAMPLLGNSAYIWIGPMTTAVSAFLIMVAIFRHQMFDIRLLIVRTIAYALTILTVILIYGVAVAWGLNALLGDTVSDGVLQVINVLSIIFVALTFQPLKKVFDTFSRNFFYQDQYEIEVVVNNITRILAEELEIDRIMQRSLIYVSHIIKSDYAHFSVVNESKEFRSYSMGSTTVAPSREFIKYIAKHKQVLVLDELHEGKTKRFLRKNKADIVVPLFTKEAMVGFLIFGPRVSGSVYPAKDKELLRISANALAVAVQNALSYEKIQEFNITLQKRVDQATSRLRASNRKLKELDKAKDEFISMASHQLRTPITTITGYLSMLHEGDAGKLTKKEDQFVNLAFMSAKRMAALVSDMLNVSRISTGKLVIEKSAVDLVELVKTEIVQLKRVAESKNVKLRLHKPKGKIPTLQLDEQKTRQVVMNFIDNAAYYAPNTTVDIYVEKVDGWVEFRVEDHGIGVPKKKQKELFTKFFRADNAREIRPDGTGLGLYMAKMVTEMQGGEIIFSSYEGEGSTFGFKYKIKK